MNNKAVTVGLRNGQLAPCPKAANCISSQHENPNRRMFPMDYEGLSMEEAKNVLVDVLHTIPKLSVVKNEGSYIHAEAKTLVFEFFHDVEFHLDDAAKEIHFRSASRLGFSDFGANKRRMQSVVARFFQKADQIKAKATD